MSPSAGGSSQLRRPPRSIPGALRSSLRSPCPACGPGRTKPSGPSLLLAEARHRPPRRGTQPRPRPASCAPPSLGPGGVRHGRDRARSLSPRQDALWGGKGTAEPRFSAGQWPGAEGSRAKGANPALCVGFLPRGVLVGRDVRPGPRPKVPHRPSQGTDPPRSSAASPSPPKKLRGQNVESPRGNGGGFGGEQRQALRPEDG